MLVSWTQEVKICGPDYIGMDKNKAMEDFQMRISHYEAGYESLDYKHDRNLSFIQIFNQGERFLVNKLAGRSQTSEQNSKMGHIKVGIHI